MVSYLFQVTPHPAGEEATSEPNQQGKYSTNRAAADPSGCLRFFVATTPYVNTKILPPRGVQAQMPAGSSDLQLRAFGRQLL